MTLPDRVVLIGVLEDGSGDSPDTVVHPELSSSIIEVVDLSNSTELVVSG